ncbi:MAG: RNA-binding domain-containing protein, partial [Nanoarchaeota archaeon]
LQIKRTTAEGFSDRIIEVNELILQKDRHCNAFLNSLLERMTKEQKEQLLNQIESRLHDNLHFYLRLDKDALSNLNLLWLTDGGNCFHLELVVAAFPKNREVAKQIIRNILTESIK